MRILIAADAIGGLPSAEVGAALGRAWAAQGAEVAVVPMGDAGGGFLAAMAAATGMEPLALPAVDGVTPIAYAGRGAVAVGLPAGEASTGLPERSSRPLGDALRVAVEVAGEDLLTAYVDLSWAGVTHDAGAGLLAGLGARADVPLDAGHPGLAGMTELDQRPIRDLLGPAALIGVIPERDREQRLLGLRGISAGRGHEADLPLERSLAADAALEAFVAATGERRAADEPGAGACGGAAFALLAVGDGVRTGPAECALVSGLAATLPSADVVVTAVDGFNFLTRGGGVVEYLARACGDAGVPLVVLAREVQVSTREMRTFGVEAAYDLALPDSFDAAALTAAAAETARTWSW